MDRTLKVQAQIRENAQEVQNYLYDMNKWEKEIKKKDKAIASHKQTGRVPIRRGAGTVQVVSSIAPTAAGNSGTKSKKVIKKIIRVPVESAVALSIGKSDKEKTAAKHTYDVGYKKWERIDFDAMCDEENENIVVRSSNEMTKTEECVEYIEEEVEVEVDDDNDDNVDDDVNNVTKTDMGITDRTILTPATLLQHTIPTVFDKATKSVQKNVPKARGEASGIDAEAAEREVGNIEFNAGNFASAIKSYTRCIGSFLFSYQKLNFSVALPCN